MAGLPLRDLEEEEDGDAVLRGNFDFLVPRGSFSPSGEFPCSMVVLLVESGTAPLALRRRATTAHVHRVAKAKPTSSEVFHLSFNEFGLRLPPFTEPLPDVDLGDDGCRPESFLRLFMSTPGELRHNNLRVCKRREIELFAEKLM